MKEDFFEVYDWTNKKICQKKMFVSQNISFKIFYIRPPKFYFLKIKFKTSNDTVKIYVGINNL